MEDNKIDIAIIRPQMDAKEVKWRGQGYSEKRLKAVKKVFVYKNALF